MTYARSTEVSDGVTDEFSIPFPYLDQAHVKVYVDDAPYDGIVTFVSAGLLSLAPVPEDGATITLVRETPFAVNAGAIPHTFQRGGISSAHLNRNYLANLYREQELADLLELGGGGSGGGGVTPPEGQIPISQVTGLQAALNDKANRLLGNLQSQSASRTNLGATALGSALFTATSTSAAQAALGLRVGIDIPAFNDPRFAGDAVTILVDIAEDGTAAENTAAIQEAIDEAEDGDGPVRVVLPAGNFVVNPLTINGNNVALEGQGQFNGGTQLTFTNATGVSLTVSGQYNVVSGIYFTSGVRRSAGFFIQTTNTFECLIERVRWDFGWNGVRVGPLATETRTRDVSARYMLGENPGIYFRGESGQGCYRLTIDNFRCDNPYPIANYSTYKARTNGTAFTAGQMSLFNG
ncbi:MAG: phage tail fiber protein, partial [Armatimonadaceae bacterium]